MRLAMCRSLFLDIYLVMNLGMGIAGAAIATVAAQLVQTFLLAIVVQRKRAKANAGSSWLLLRPGLPSRSRILRFLAFAGPIFLVLLGKISCYNAMTLAATASGVVALAAHQGAPLSPPNPPNPTRTLSCSPSACSPLASCLLPHSNDLRLFPWL